MLLSLSDINRSVHKSVPSAAPVQCVWPETCGQSTREECESGKAQRGDILVTYKRTTEKILSPRLTKDKHEDRAHYSKCAVMKRL